MNYLSNLESKIPNFLEFKKFIAKYKDIVDKGKLAEYYCGILFNLTPIKPFNAKYDALTQEGKKVEIKHRIVKSTIPPGMKIDLEIIDLVYYVYLNDDLLPTHIYKFNKNDLRYTVGKRVSFRNAFENKKYELLYRMNK